MKRYLIFGLVSLMVTTTAFSASQDKVISHYGISCYFKDKHKQVVSLSFLTQNKIMNGEQQAYVIFSSSKLIEDVSSILTGTLNLKDIQTPGKASFVSKVNNIIMNVDVNGDKSHLLLKTSENSEEEILIDTQGTCTDGQQGGFIGVSN